MSLCFESFGFPVNCAEVGWLLEVGFIGLLVIDGTDMDIDSSGVQNLSFGRPGASTFGTLETILAAGVHPAGPWSNREDTWGSGTKFLLIFG